MRSWTGSAQSIERGRENEKDTTGKGDGGRLFCYVRAFVVSCVRARDRRSLFEPVGIDDEVCSVHGLSAPCETRHECLPDYLWEGSSDGYIGGRMCVVYDASAGDIWPSNCYIF